MELHPETLASTDHGRELAAVVCTGKAMGRICRGERVSVHKVKITTAWQPLG
jgi:hypothetical protein